MAVGDSPSAPDRLDGWKDIASYLNRSVRTAIRWEKLLGLPVRRLHTAGGEVVYAFKAEIDEWLRLNPPSPAPTADADVKLHQPASTVHRRWRLRHAIVMLLALSAVSATVLTLAPFARTQIPAPPRGIPARWRLDGNALIVSDSADQELWRHLFEFEQDKGPVAEPSADGARVQIADIDGDGRREVLMTVSDRDPSYMPYLYAFEDSGDVRFKHAIDKVVRYGPDEYGPPFSFVRMTTIPGRPLAPVVVAAQHRPWFPVAVQFLSARGEVRSEYWTNGHVTVVASVHIGSRVLVAVGGVHNETNMGSLALLDPSRPAAIAPAEHARFRCSSCAGTWPVAFFLFPQTALGARLATSPPVTEVAEEPDAGIRVAVRNVGEVLPGDRQTSMAHAYYKFDSDLQFVDASLGRDAQQAHARATALKLYTPAKARRESQRITGVRKWNGSHFVPVPLKR